MRCRRVAWVGAKVEARKKSQQTCLSSPHAFSTRLPTLPSLPSSFSVFPERPRHVQQAEQRDAPEPKNRKKKVMTSTAPSSFPLVSSLLPSPPESGDPSLPPFLPPITSLRLDYLPEGTLDTSPSTSSFITPPRLTRPLAIPTLPFSSKVNNPFVDFEEVNFDFDLVVSELENVELSVVEEEERVRVEE